MVVNWYAEWRIKKPSGFQHFGLKKLFTRIHIYVSRAFRWNKRFFYCFTKSADIGQNMDFPIKSYLTRKIYHFERIKMFFHGSQPYRWPLLLSKVYLKNIHATSLSWYAICRISLKIFYFIRHCRNYQTEIFFS